MREIRGVELKEIGAIPRGRRIVLVCEDEPLILMNLAEMLTELGYHVLETSDGAGALAMAADNHFDVLITDVGLPDMSGRALAERISGSRPEAPIIFATGRAKDDLADLAMSGTAIGYLSKPFSLDTLKSALQEVGATGRHDS